MTGPFRLDGALGQLQDTIEALGEYAMSETEIESARTMLNSLIQDLQSDPVQTTGETAFGQHWWGGHLGHHTSIAERHVTQTINDLVTGLNDYRDAVDNAERMAVDTDGDTAARLRALASAALVVDDSIIAEGSACIDAPDLSNNPTCQP